MNTLRSTVIISVVIIFLIQNGFSFHHMPMLKSDIVKNKRNYRNCDLTESYPIITSVSSTSNRIQLENLKRSNQQQQRKLHFPSTAIIPLYSIIIGSTMKIFIRNWIKSNAWSKFQSSGGIFGIYATIPIVAGVVNMITNRLAVWMLFNPINFQGVEIIKRKEGDPFTLFGIQGIVPAKTVKMGTDLSTMLLNKLINIKDVFGRLSAKKLGSLLAFHLTATIEKSIKTLLSTNLEFALKLIESNKSYKEFYDKTIKEKVIKVLERIIIEIQSDPEKYIDIKSMILKDLVKDKKIICDLFQKCGRDELKFIVTTGLWGGFALGIIQMLLWLVWSPPWSLAVGGAVVGYATDWFALKIMFEPVIPVFFFNNRVKIQGLFLQRQNEVSVEFSEFVSTKLLSSQQLWEELTISGKRKENLEKLISKELQNELSWLLPHVTEKQWSKVSSTIQNQIPVAASSMEISNYTTSSLDLKNTIEIAMKKMSSSDFEKVLHPIFQEDELTLILVGTILGAIAGFAQVPFY